MMLAHPLKLQQHQPFCEGFPQGWGVFLIHSKGPSGWDQDSAQASQILQHQTLTAKPLRTLLCALGHSHVAIGTPKLFPQSWEHEIVQNALLCQSNNGSFHGNYEAEPSACKTAPQHHPLSTKLYAWHNAVKQEPFSWQPPYPDVSIGLPDRSVIRHSRAGLHCSRVQRWCDLFHCISRFTLHLVTSGVDAAVSWKTIHRLPHLVQPSGYLQRSAAIDSMELLLLCPFYDFTSYPLCYETVNSWLWNI